VPSFARPALAGIVAGAARQRRRAEDRLAERRLSRIGPGDTFTYRGHTIRVNDSENVRVLCRDLFDGGIYGFDADRPDPRILDCGSNIGMSLLYFKDLYPGATIVALEPDPAIFPYLEENVRTNGLSGVELVHAAVGDRDGTLAFVSDGKYGSRLADVDPDDVPAGWERYEVPCVRLADLLDEPVEFMKMNIEGAETSVLQGGGDALRQVREMIIEYHRLPGLPRTLHTLLETLDRHGFDYAVHDYYGPRRGPFRLTPETRAFPLVHARRID
jgi:FkbM family methyltransferase